MLNQKLSQKLLQKLSPQQIQFIKLLQLNTLTFEQRVEEELIDNPALEEGVEDDIDRQEEDDDLDRNNEEERSLEDTFDIEDLLNDNQDGIRLAENNYNDDEEDREIPIVERASFRELLSDQWHASYDDEHILVLGDQIIGTLDDDGYLRRPLKSIANDLLFTQNVQTTEEELEKILLEIQSFDPAGIAARDLQECLILQLNRKEKEKGRNAVMNLAKEIIDKYMDDFSKKHYSKLIQKLEVEEDYLKEAITFITKLNPKPAQNESVSGGGKDYVIPDFIVKEQYGELEVLLNSRNAPELKISRSYLETLKAFNESKKKEKSAKDTVQFIKQKLDGAKWFIDSIKQRQHTLLATMNAIVDYQKAFFTEGDESKLRPMILKDIAEKIGMDISTVSRVANSKYVQTDFGIYLLKYFFSEGIVTDSGEEVSNREVKRILSEAIGEEDKKKPLTDQKLMEILKEKGYPIARRTVAKYREQLNIPVARLRKEL